MTATTTRRRSRASPLRRRPRSTSSWQQRATILQELDGPLHLLGERADGAANRHARRSRRGSRRPIVGLPAWPHGTGTEVGRGQPPDSARVDRGPHRGVLDLARVDEPFGSAEHGGQGDGRLDPLVVELEADVDGAVAHARACLTPVANGRSSSWASSGPTCPVSASTEFRPTRTRSKGPIISQRGGQRTRRGRACRSRRTPGR